MLVPALLERLSARLAVAPRTLSAEAKRALADHPWPGNVRELRNVLERALVVAPAGEIRLEDLPALRAAAPGADRGAPAGPPPLSLAERERAAILEALERSGGNREQAAGLLGISVRTLYTRLREYGLR